MTTPTGILFYEPRAKPLSTIGTIQPGAYYQFYLTTTTTPATVYADGALTTPLSQTPGIGQTTAASDGRLVPIYMNPAVIYRVQLYSSLGVLLEDVDPYIPVYNPIVTQAQVGQILWPQTTAEQAAGVTPTSYAYPPLDVRRYGWINDGAVSGSPPVYTGTNNYTAFANALLVAGQAGSSGAGATVTIPSGGTNLAVVKGSSTLIWPDNTGINVDQNVNIAWNDNSTGAFCLTNGAASARHGNIFSQNLTILLATQTAGGLRLFNTVSGTYINTYIQGYTGNYGTRSNVGLRMEATPVSGACWFNDFYGLNLNHCHTGIFLPSASDGYVTQNTFRNLRFFGDSNLGDTTSIGVFAQAGSFCIVDGFWIEAAGTYGFDLQGVGNWYINNGTFDSSEGPFTAIYFDPNTSTCKVGKNVVFSPGAYIQNAAPATAGNFVEVAQGAFNGDTFSLSHQSSFGLNDAQGYIGTFLRPPAGGLVIHNNQQTIQGGCYNPLDNLLYLVSKEGNLLAYSPALQQVTNFVAYSANASTDTDPLYACFCPVNNRIYVSSRQDNSIVVIDPRTWTVIQTLSLVATAGANCKPYQIAYCPFNQKIYIANFGTNNVSIITPTGNGADSVAQTLSGFAVPLIAMAYCPITQKMYAGGNSTSVFIITTTTNATDSIAQTLAATLGTGCYAISYCPTNQKMYAVSSGSTKFVSINPTTGGTDSVLTSSTLVANGNSASATRGICWNQAAGAMMCIGGGNLLATILPSNSGSSDICTQVQATTGGTSLQIIYHPNLGKAYELNPAVSSVMEWS